MANPLAKLLKVFGNKSAAADSIAIALAERDALRERLEPARRAHIELTGGGSTLDSGESPRSILNVGRIDDYSQVRNGKLQGNPYWVELGRRYPVVMDWINEFPRYGANQPEGAHAVRRVTGKYADKVGQERHEEAKRFIGEDFESTLDSLIQEYGFDKLEMIDGNK